MDIAPATLALLRLTLVEGLGPATIAKLVSLAGSAEEALELSPSQIGMCKIGPDRASRIAAGIKNSLSIAEDEISRAEKLGVRFVSVAESLYPALLREVPDPPPILYYKGKLAAEDRFAVAMVGSRRCTAYGLEQTTRFSGTLARAGMTVVSGGARGIDTAAHRAALMSEGRTLAVLGCGLAHAYPPENAQLFERIASPDSNGIVHGAVISELPIETAPDRCNFPRRNRIISGLSLGVLVIEAARGSGALITAQQAVEEHGREVFALPGRVDSAASEGTNDLLKAGGAAMVTEPADVIALLESAARHQHAGTHAARYATENQTGTDEDEVIAGVSASHAPSTPTLASTAPITLATPLPEEHLKILSALDRERSADELVEITGLAASSLRSHLTMLEITKRVQRVGARFAKRGG